MEKYVEVVFLDVGQGDAIVIILPDHERCILLDTPNINSKKNIVFEFLKKKQIKKIELAIITHSDKDHSGVADILMMAINQEEKEKITIDKFFFFPSANEKKTLSYEVLCKQIDALRENGLTYWNINTSQSEDYDDVTLKIIYPNMFDRIGASISENVINNTACIVKLEYAGEKFLFGADVEGFGWKQLLKWSIDELKSDVFKVPHHGAALKKVEYDKLLNAIAPEYSVISVGSNNHYGHPTKSTLQELLKAKSQILCTERSAVCNRIKKEDEYPSKCCGTISFKVAKDENEQGRKLEITTECLHHPAQCITNIES